MRALATGLLTFLIFIQSSMPHAQGWNSAVTPLNPGKHRHSCPGAGYYDNVQTCRPVAASTISPVITVCAKVEAKTATWPAAILFCVHSSPLAREGPPEGRPQITIEGGIHEAIAYQPRGFTS